MLVWIIKVIVVVVVITRLIIHVLLSLTLNVAADYNSC